MISLHFVETSQSFFLLKCDVTVGSRMIILSRLKYAATSLYLDDFVGVLFLCISLTNIGGR